MYFCFLCGESLIEVGTVNMEEHYEKYICVCPKCSAVWWIVIIHYGDDTIDYSLHCTEPDVMKIKERIENENKD